MDEVIKKMSEEDILKENYYRYCHELNKTNFLLKLAKTLTKSIISY